MIKIIATTTVLIFLLAMALVFSGDDSSDKQIIIATEGTYPPFNYIDDNNQLTGFDVDIIKAICKEEKLNCKIVTNAWEGLLVGLVTGRFDAVVSSVSITKKRAKNVLFTERYYQTPIHFIALKGSDIAIDEAGLKGKIIGVQSSTTGSQYMRDKYSNIANIKQYPDSITMKIDALAGRVDVFVIDAVAGWSWMNSDEGKNFQFVGSPVNVDEGIAIALNKNNDKLRDIFNTALETIMENGEYDRINSKYFNYSIY